MAIRKTAARTVPARNGKLRRSHAGAAARQRAVPPEIDTADARKPVKASAPPAPQAKPASTRARTRPQPPLPHPRTPGRESTLPLRPPFEVPDYRGSGKLDGMVALITGGDSGIGRAVAVLFAREGAQVAVVYLAEEAAARETRAHVEKEGRRCLLIRGDVADPPFCREAVAETIAAFGKLDVLVNNAVSPEPAESLEEITDAQFDRTMHTHVYGYFNMTRAALRHLGKGASIINTGAEAGLFGSAQRLDHAATQGAIHAFTLSLASNLAARGIRVNAVAPGPAGTPPNPAERQPRRAGKRSQHAPASRPAQPEELSPAYVFLAAPSCASSISGVILSVTGGRAG